MFVVGKVLGGVYRIFRFVEFLVINIYANNTVRLLIHVVIYYNVLASSFYSRFENSSVNDNGKIIKVM